MNYGTMPEQDDLPPKYEDCEELPPEYFEEEQPPVYDEATMRPDNLYSNKCDNSIIIFDRNYCYENKTFQLWHNIHVLIFDTYTNWLISIGICKRDYDIKQKNNQVKLMLIDSGIELFSSIFHI